MSDAISMLRERVAKAEAKVQRSQKALESARSELADLHTTLRVMADITGESVLQSASGAIAAGSRQFHILQLLGTGIGRSKAPAEIFEAYNLIGDEDINADTFRTTIWRMKGKRFKVDAETFTVRSDGGHYWKDLVPDHETAPGAETPEADDFTGLADGSQGGATHLHPEGSIPSSSTSVKAPVSDFDDLDDVPF